MQLFITRRMSIYVRQMNLLPFLLHLPDGSLDVTRGNPLTCVRHENIAQESTRNLKMTFVFIDILSAFLVNSHVLIDYQVFLVKYHSFLQSLLSLPFLETQVKLAFHKNVDRWTTNTLDLNDTCRLRATTEPIIDRRPTVDIKLYLQFTKYNANISDLIQNVKVLPISP